MALSQVQDADWDDDSFLRLYPTTLAGTVIQMRVPVSIHHTWEMLEEYLIEHLPRNSLIETFGCELTLINVDTQIALQDPIQEDLWKNNQFSLVAHDCFRISENNKPLQGLEYEDCPKAIRVPVTDSGILEAKAFHSTARVRHVKLDIGFGTVSPGVATLPFPEDSKTGGHGCCDRSCSLPEMLSLQVVEMPGCVEPEFSLNAVRLSVSETS